MRLPVLIALFTIAAADLEAQGTTVRGTPPPPQPPNPGMARRDGPTTPPTPMAPRAPGGDDLMRNLIPPELIMSRQAEIGLQDSQRASIVKEMSQAQAKFTETQWSLSAGQEKLQRLLQANPIDEGAVLKQLDQVLTLEQDLKRTQMGMMIRVKNILTAEQQAKLRPNLGQRCIPGPNGQQECIQLAPSVKRGGGEPQ
jgi:Spy/CpxP family protein refolding chaperone